MSIPNTKVGSVQTDFTVSINRMLFFEWIT